MRAAKTDSLRRTAVARLAVALLLAACSSDHVIDLLVTADHHAGRLRVEVKGPLEKPVYTEEFDVDPAGSGRDISDPTQAYKLALKLGEDGKFGVHIVDITGGVATQSWAEWVDVAGVVHKDAHLDAFRTGDDDDGDGWPEQCGPDVPAGACLADCNDGAAGTHPFAVDVCQNGVDEDCTGSDRMCEDADHDGYDERTDCDDHDPNVNPGEHESSTTCDGPDPKCGNGKDDDCMGGDAVCHTDKDCDGFWPLGENGGTDCNDDDPTVHPGAIDVCGDMIDQNCDGTADNGCERCDEDGDGEDGNHPERGCVVAPGMADCDDANRAVNHGSTADCGGNEGGAACARRGFCGRSPAIDEDCDGMVNEGCPDPSCDADADGFARSDCPTPPPAGLADCDDTNPHIYPGAPDACGDGVAQNCSIDLPCGTDADGDGWDASIDCDDHDPLVHPWGDETCNGKDDDCDGVIDEGNPGTTVGSTLDGASCNFDNDGLCAGATGHCVCSSTSSDGVMDPAGNRVFCPGETPVAGPWGPRCFGATEPTPERCDGSDWDCNGTPSDPTGVNLADKGMPCDNLPAPCVQGVVVGCDFSAPPHAYYTNQYWVCSSDERGPQPEICNGIDDNCNMQIDELFTLGIPCDGPDSDQCNEGVTQCSPSGGVECSDSTGNNVETCNGVDDDCNGVIDDGYPGLGTPCDGPDTDFCNEGTIICNGMGTGTMCSDMTGNSVEICNGIDDNCNGTVDEGYANLGVPCDGPDTDLCNEGVIACNAMGTGTVCSDMTGNNVELCNGIDDNCNGTIDEGYMNLGVPCDGPDTDLCNEGFIVCNALGTGTTCSDNTGNNVELCNNLDDNCNGMIDETFPLKGTMCDGPDTDMCLEGTWICNGPGTGLTCTDMTGNSTEICNNLDDDCDGTIDDGSAASSCAPLGDTCGAGGICKCGVLPTTCNASKADNCTAGICMCGAGPACVGSHVCTSGTCP